jgi:flagellar biosynthesis protein FlhF
MQIKKFEAKTMAEALRKVKREFGSDAVILSARSAKTEPSVFGLRSPKVEVTAAKDSTVAHHQEEQMATGTYNHTGTVTRRVQATLPGRSEPSDHVNIRTRRIPVQRSGANPIKRSRLKPWKAKNPTWEAGRDDAAQRAEFEKCLVHNGVDKRLAHQLWQAITPLPDTLGKGNQEPTVTVQLQKCIEDRRLVAGDIVFDANGPKIVSLLGTSGVGKTTTLAKIASQQACLHKRRVALISLDDCRIAANAELKVYARILDIPLRVGSDQSSLQEALQAFQDHDLILIDTPGLMTDQPESLNMLSLLTSTGMPVDHYLLLSAATREQELARMVKHLDLLKLTGFIFTKLDECSVCGHLLNLLLRTQVPAAFITAGNRVPEDITLLSAEGLARMIVGSQTHAPVSEPVPATRCAAHRADYQEQPDAWHYVANKKTDLYHSPLCESAKRIKGSNIAHFKTREAAERQQFQPCRLCIPGPSDQRAMPAPYAV